jgi:hypothetical protein
MVLFLIVGELGRGKTLSLTSLCWNHWFHRKEKIFSNYHLFGIPYYHIKGVNQIDQCKDGFLALDEIWRIMDAYSSRSYKTRVTADILARSRKRDLTYCMTAQVMSSLAPRIRQVIDFTAYPKMNEAETLLKLIIFKGNKGIAQNYIKALYFKTEDIYRLYDTKEEIDMEEQVEEYIRPVFQESYNREHGYWCECETCKTVFFETWEEADKYAESYWKKNEKKVA